MAMNQTEGVQTLYSPRGTIYDTNGKELAFSIMVKSLYADPGTMNVSAAEAAKDLAPILKKNESDLAKAMSRKTRFVWLERLMDPEDSDKVQALIKEKGWKGFGFFDESRRFYPNGPMAANVLGFVGLDDKGLDGLEMSLDDLIRGGKSKQMLLTDARGNPILESALAPYKAENERSVYLTIDQNIQFYAERALDRAMTSTKASGGIIIVMDPKTGAILALGNRPSYDPNHFDKATEAEFKNRAVVDIYEPGSTFKPVIAAAALAAKTYDTQRVWHDPGAVWASGHAIRNWDDESYGDVRLVDILKFSINTGFAHIGLLTGGDILTEYAKKFRLWETDRNRSSWRGIGRSLQSEGNACYRCGDHVHRAGHCGNTAPDGAGIQRPGKRRTNGQAAYHQGNQESGWKRLQGQSDGNQRKSCIQGSG